MSLCVYILLGTLIAVSEWRRHRRGEHLNAMTAFNVSYFVLFVLVPINVMYFGEEVIRQKYAYESYGPGDILTALSLLLCYVLFCLGYWWKSPKRPRGDDRSEFSLRDSAHVATMIFFAGAALMAIYTLQVGGIREVISEATAIRFGEVQLEGKYLFYTYFCRFCADAFVLFLAIVVGKKARQASITTRDKGYLVAALLLFVYYGLSTAGRRPFIEPILLCFLIYWSMGAKIKKTAVVALALIFLIAGVGTILGPVILSGNLGTALDIYQSTQDGWTAGVKIAYDNASQGLADSYIHFVGMQKASLWQFGFVPDIVSLPLDLLPSRLLGFKRNYEPYRQMNDFFGEHLPEDEDGAPLGGGEPLGLHGYLLVNFGYVGLFALFFLLGLFYKWMHVRFKPSDPKDAVGWLVYWWVVLGFFVYFREGVLLFVLKTQMTWWIIIGLLLYYRGHRLAAARRSPVGAEHGIA